MLSSWIYWPFAHFSSVYPSSFSWCLKGIWSVLTWFVPFWGSTCPLETSDNPFSRRRTTPDSWDLDQSRAQSKGRSYRQATFLSGWCWAWKCSFRGIASLFLVRPGSWAFRNAHRCAPSDHRVVRTHQSIHSLVSISLVWCDPNIPVCRSQRPT